MNALKQVLPARFFLTLSVVLLLLWPMFAFPPVTVSAQQKPAIAGDYAGTLGSLHLKLHLKADGAGAITGTLDSTDQGAMGIPCADFHLDGQAFAFSVPAVHGSWKGSVSVD